VYLPFGGPGRHNLVIERGRGTSSEFTAPTHPAMFLIGESTAQWKEALKQGNTDAILRGDFDLLWIVLVS